MGMAASQARLLCITARIHDVEYQAQSIQNAKVQLATQSDRVYEEYMEALDSQTLAYRVADPLSGAQSTVAATFNNLCSSKRLRAANGEEYCLRDARGRLIVEPEVAEAYEKYKKSGASKSAEAFAMYMLDGYNNYNNVTKFNERMQAVEESTWAYLNSKNSESAPSDRLVSLREALEDMVGPNIYNSDNLSGDDLKKYQELLAEYRDEMTTRHYEAYGDNYVSEMGVVNVNPRELMESFRDKFEYYVSIYKQLEANGGACISIDKFDGFAGSAANDSEWLTAMVQSGQISISTVTKDDDGGVKIEAASPSSDTNVSYTETTSIDSRAAKKAEAKYEHDLREIENKDKQYDLTLSKLETERTALTTEYDSVKKVIEDNIERTFGIFS